MKPWFSFSSEICPFPFIIVAMITTLFRTFKMAYPCRIDGLSSSLKFSILVYHVHSHSVFRLTWPCPVRSSLENIVSGQSLISWMLLMFSFSRCLTLRIPWVALPLTRAHLLSRFLFHCRCFPCFFFCLFPHCSLACPIYFAWEKTGQTSPRGVSLSRISIFSDLSQLSSRNRRRCHGERCRCNI